MLTYFGFSSLVGQQTVNIHLSVSCLQQACLDAGQRQRVIPVCWVFGDVSVNDRTELL